MFKNMKSFLLTSLFVLTISQCILLASAAPTKPKAAAPGHKTTAAPASSEAIAVSKAVAYIKSPSAALNPSCFYSGFTEHETSKEMLHAMNLLHEKWIDKKLAPYNCHFIVNVVDDSKVDSSHITDWSQVSLAFAQSVSGTVHVLLGKTINPNSVWVKEERQALKNNAKVTAVEVWEIETNGSVVKTAKTKATM